jgi:predicted DNA-binding transcriptional regulator AlpA
MTSQKLSLASRAVTVAHEPVRHAVLSAPPPPQPAPAALSVRAMCERLDISESTFHRIRDEAWFPRPIMLSSKICRWIWVEVEDALRQRAPRLAVGANAEPEELTAARPGRKYRSGVPA